MEITSTIHLIGVNDHTIDLFESQYPVPNGMAYNSYLILDDRTAVMDSVDAAFAQEWLDRIHAALGGRSPDYLIVQHMEPDHSGSILQFMNAYPNATIVASARAFVMMKHFFGQDFPERRMAVGDQDTLSLGSRTLTFFTASMVHWPEVIMTYDPRDHVLFSADAFGAFGALDTEGHWPGEARRYYFGIVGKYGAPVQAVLKKLSALEIRVICSLHGPVLKENISYYIDLYNLWSRFEAEEEGIVIAYTSVYGNTAKAVRLLAELLGNHGCSNVIVHDLARCDLSAAVEDAFRYSKLVLASTTYNGGVFPFMRTFLSHLTERGYSNRTVALIENGSWAPAAARVMKGCLDQNSQLAYAETMVRITSSLNEESTAQLTALAEELSRGPAAVRQ